MFSHGPFESLHVSGNAEHGNEVAARRNAPSSDSVRVQVVGGGGLAADPADGGLDIVNLRGPGGLLAETIVGAHAGVFARFHEGLEAPAAGALVALEPGAAVDEDDHRQFFGFRPRGQIEIEALSRIFAVSVGDVGDDVDRLGSVGGQTLLGNFGAFLCRQRKAQRQHQCREERGRDSHGLRRFCRYHDRERRINPGQTMAGEEMAQPIHRLPAASTFALGRRRRWAG